MSHIALLTTGGTIASSRDENGISRPGAVEFDFAVPVRVTDLMSKDSSSFDFSDMDRIVDAVAHALQDPECDGVVVLHGTDTMEETALLVDLFHDDPRPVVFTGAQRTSDHADPDGPSNVAAAVDAVLNPSGPGVFVVFGGRILPARGLSKRHTSELDAFVSSAEERVILPRTEISGVRVDIVALYPGADAVAIDAYRAAGAHGIVLQALGSGNTNADVVAAVKACTAEGIPVVITTRVPEGSIEPSYGGGGGGADLVDAGAEFSPLLRAGQARVLLAARIATRL
ncbi:asparaginase [Rhodococcoides kyotonense]|uniref:asparaginase n=1 Tax=Rhodococcoides kyotonense TaxID=398843 RepID=A0A239G333_9NOCA|nr:asparaginase [Rhodococcus kyotonensis]SNS63589.1 L-asparaginase [Rhodococcus kyotonensis]